MRKGICKLFFIVLIGMVMFSLSGCEKKASLTEESEHTIHFYCYQLGNVDKQVVDIAAKKFNEMYPEYTVQLTQFKEKNYTADKYVTMVNTQLMSGEGYDIITLNHLPVQKYFEKGLFYDLEQSILNSEEFDENLYFKNVIDACRYKGKLYALPVHFNIRAMIASKAILEEEGIQIDDHNWDMQDLLEYSKRVTRDIDGNGVMDQYAFPKFDISVATSLFLETEKFIDYENKTASYDSEGFSQLVQCLKDFSDSNLMHKEIELGGEREYKDRNATVFAGNEIYGFRGLLYTKYQLGGGEINLYKLPTTQPKENNTVVSRLMLAVNNKSEKKQYTVEFLKLLLSEQSQGYYGMALGTQGFPLMKEEFDHQLESVNMLDWRLMNSGGWIPVVLSDSDIQFVRDYISSIDRMTFIDEKILGIVTYDINKLLSSRNAIKKNEINNTIRDIQNKVTIYLEE